MSDFHLIVIALLVLILIEVCTPMEKRGESSVKLVFGGAALYALYWLLIGAINVLSFVYDSYGKNIAIFLGVAAFGISGYGVMIFLQKSIDYLIRTVKKRKLAKQTPLNSEAI